MNHEHGIEVSGEFSLLIRACIGLSLVAGVLLLAGAPFVLVLGRALYWLKWW